MSNDLEYKGYIGSVEFSAEDKRLFGKVLFIDSLLMYSGESIRELEAAFHETVDAYLELCAAKGREPNKSYSGSFNIRIGSDLHRKCAIEAHRRGHPERVHDTGCCRRLRGPTRREPCRACPQSPSYGDPARQRNRRDASRNPAATYSLGTDECKRQRPLSL